MSRNVVSVVVAFALLVGGSLISTDSSAQAGHCGGGLFAKLKASRSSNCCAPAVEAGCGGYVEVGCGGSVERSCGGGLFAKLRARCAARKASCCAPEPVCCAPEPVCCEPAPAPAPCCEPAPAPCCGAAPVAQPCCGAVSGGVVYGETIINEAPAHHAQATDAPVESASDEVPPAPVPANE